MKRGVYSARWVGTVASAPADGFGFVDVWADGVRIARRQTNGASDVQRRQPPDCRDQLHAAQRPPTTSNTGCGPTAVRPSRSSGSSCPRRAPDQPDADRQGAAPPRQARAFASDVTTPVVSGLYGCLAAPVRDTLESTAWPPTPSGCSTSRRRPRACRATSSTRSSSRRLHADPADRAHLQLHLGLRRPLRDVQQLEARRPQVGHDARAARAGRWTTRSGARSRT